MDKKLLTENTFLFPFTVLPESYYRFISITLPAIKILQIMRPVYKPSWAVGEIQGYPIFRDDNHVKKIQEIYRGYQDYAKIHGEKHLLETLSLAKLDEQWHESRFHLKRVIKEGEESKLSDEWVSILESALLLELARDLDEKDIELDMDLVQIHSLEDKFREALGLDESETEVEDAIRVTAEALPRRSYFGYLVKKRIEAWFRLMSHNPPAKTPILTCITKDVADEVIDPIRTKYEKEKQEKWTATEETIVSMPNVLDYISGADFERSRDRLSDFNRPRFWNTLEAYVNDPEGESTLINLKEMGHTFSQTLNDIFGSMGIVPASFIELSVFYHPCVSCGALETRILKVKNTVFDYAPAPMLIIDERIVED